jgi:hypothetical protein
MNLETCIKKDILNNILMYMLKKSNQIHYKVIMIWTYENMAHFKSLKIL